MRHTFEIAPDELLAAVEGSTKTLEAGDGSPMKDRIRSLITRAGETFVSSARPRGMWQRISSTDFAAVYDGEGGNDPNTPLDVVLEEATSLALFAVTAGQALSTRIARLFEEGDLAEGYLLDQIASFAADELATLATRRFVDNEGTSAETAALPYSPGYCGWNVSGQRALFASLAPEEIGISLNESCLMHPVKSVSGVLVLAPISAHDFSPAFPCCASCTTLACQERVAELKDTAGLR